MATADGNGRVSKPERSGPVGHCTGKSRQNHPWRILFRRAPRPSSGVDWREGTGTIGQLRVWGGGAPLPMGADLRRACHRIWSPRTRPVKGPLLLLPALFSLLLLLFPLPSAGQVQSQESLSQSEAHREEGLMGCPLHLPGSRCSSRAQGSALSRTKRPEAGG